ncbi:hypothetical protein HN51_041498 [Arachis hypogaea]|uniref:Uncharacterized protein n=1 Tax=Arachis hypogaea TaxID=3818 RepID=A0A444YSW3_ARAHY|nr:hypothetical protein Ahy_B06g084824 [Arachis hypogaea]
MVLSTFGTQGEHMKMVSWLKKMRSSDISFNSSIDNGNSFRRRCGGEEEEGEQRRRKRVTSNGGHR